MARHYYLTRSGRLRRKDNTLVFELAEDERDAKAASSLDEFTTHSTSELSGQRDASSVIEGESVPAAETKAGADAVGDASTLFDDAGDLSFEPPDLPLVEMDETVVGNVAGDSVEDDCAPVRVTERRTIPVADVEAVWAFGELDLNARVLVFLSQNRIPLHIFNYYGFYAGSYYPREYLQAGYLTVRQVRHYSNRKLRIIIARQFVRAAMHNILRNLRYYDGRGVGLQAETEGVQTEMLRLDEAGDINQLMGCEGRARAAYYQGFAKILRNDVDFTKRVRRPPDNIVNAMISFTNGLVYSATLSQIYRTQLDPTISFLHEPGARRFSLALDLAEVFKPILADRMLFKLLNTRQLDARHFAQDLNCCYLNERGRKVVLKEWDARLQTTIEHRRLKRKVSYERLIRLECYKLVKHLTGVEPYTGFHAWW